MNQDELLRYGNELTICGFIVGNALETHIFEFPENGDLDGQKQIKWIDINDEEIHKIIRQMDVQEIEGLQKVILRKSQRNIDQKVAWEVFRRDNFTCVYCGADDVPMSIDHIVLWEHMGDTVSDNLNCSCKKCNKTRGSMLYADWINSSYFYKIIQNAQYKTMSDGIHEVGKRIVAAKLVPLRKTKRSR